MVSVDDAETFFRDTAGEYTIPRCFMTRKIKSYTRGMVQAHRMSVSRLDPQGILTTDDGGDPMGNSRGTFVPWVPAGFIVGSPIHGDPTRREILRILA